MVTKLLPEAETYFDKGGRNIYKAKVIGIVKEASFVLKHFWKWYGSSSP